MKTYSITDQLPDLPASPPEPGYECNDCGFLFDLPVPRHRDPDGHDDICPSCEARDIHRT